MQKEAMKVHCVNTYVEVCYSIIVTFRTSCPPIAKSCLDNLRAYLGMYRDRFCTCALRIAHDSFTTTTARARTRTHAHAHTARSKL
jgi:hypothetical protein